ncbi:9816_t:CDS:2 [Funneliformis geosporum]|nr:9816_t:CDS:2 [Funneliformis geosporum]
MLGLDKDNNNEAYNLIKTASDYPIAQLYLGRCYKNGFGIDLRIIYKIDSNEGFMKSFYYLNRYYGITKDPNTDDLIIILKYYKCDLKTFIAENFNNLGWDKKLCILKQIIRGLHFIHSQSIIHQDFHSGNILCENEYDIVISDLGISKLSADLSDNNEFYCIISYTAPEIFQGKKSEKCTKASDIYSFGMIMWELMVGRRPFWDRDYDTLLIIDICDNIRPSIVTNAPKGYIEIMQECWSADPNKRPTTIHIWNLIDEFFLNEKKVPTKIILSSDIGPIIENEFIKDSYNEDYISKAFEFDI